MQFKLWTFFSWSFGRVSMSKKMIFFFAGEVLSWKDKPFWMTSRTRQFRVLVLRHAVFLVFLRCFLLKSGESSPKHFSQLWAHQNGRIIAIYHVFDFPQQTTGFFGRFQLGHHSKGLVEATILIRMVKLPDFHIKKTTFSWIQPFSKERSSEFF